MKVKKKQNLKILNKIVNNLPTIAYFFIFTIFYFSFSILEPSMDIPIAEEHEEFYLKEVQILCDRVNEVERTLAPKPLPEILLPNSLDEFTWSALGKTLTDLHKYISDNNMVTLHFIIYGNFTFNNIEN